MTTLFRTLALLAAMFLSQMFSSQMFSSQSALAQVPPNQTYPNKTIRMIVTFAPGGPTDVIGRIIAQKVSESWGQQVVVENVPGGGGNIGLAAALRAPSDGYTIVTVSTGFIVNPSLYAKVPYVIKDFAPISLVAASPNVITVNPSVPARTVMELIRFVKDNPGKHSYAHAGLGTPVRGWVHQQLAAVDDLRVQPVQQVRGQQRRHLGQPRPRRSRRRRYRSVPW